MDIPQELITKLQQLARNNPHRECCGVLVDNKIVHISNVAKDNDSFIFSKQEWLKLLNSKAEVQLIWHTHPGNSTPLPSPADLAMIKRLNYDSLIVTASDWRYIECQKI